MSWRQRGVALTVAVAVGAVLLVNSGWVVAAVAVVSFYFGIRWAITTYYRTRYWVQRPGRETKTCPGCGQPVRRLSGDMILTCQRCGWRIGWPVARWATWSVPARQIRRTVSVGGLAAGLILFVIIIPLLGAITASLLPVYGPLATVGDPFEPDVDAIDEREVEELVLEKVNDRRAERDYSPLEYNENAAQQARSHAEDMATNNYFDHTSLEGETQQERYQFCRGGENIAQTRVDQRISAEGGTDRYTTSEELAAGLITQWMHSDPHRERGIYGDRWSSSGVGIAITDDDKVYAVNSFCQTNEGVG